MSRAFSRRKLHLWLAVLAVFAIVNLWVFANYSHHDAQVVPIHHDTFSEFRASDNEVHKTNLDDKDPKHVLTELSRQLKQVTAYVNNTDIHKLFTVFNKLDTRAHFDQHAKVYYDIFSRNKPTLIIGNLDFSQRCDLYFSNLFAKDQTWSVDLKRKFYTDFRKEQKFHDFSKNNDVKKKYLKEVKKIKDPKAEDMNLLKDDKGYMGFVRAEYDLMKANTAITKAEMGNILSAVRVFNKCYVMLDNELDATASSYMVNQQKKLIGKVDKPQLSSSDAIFAKVESCKLIENRVYPWMLREFPIYERWNGEIQFQPPNYAKIDSVPKYIPTNKTAHKLRKAKLSKNWHSLIQRLLCFLNEFKQKMNGKGIVMSIGEHHVEEAISLIRLLRALENRLPIQIVYFDNLSENSKQRLIKAARDVLLDLPSTFESVKDRFNKEYLDNTDEKGRPVGLPPQELWFVSVNKAIDYNYRDPFKKFGNKFLATTFNSFAEFLLLDADTVIVKTPQWFFDQPKYKKTGAFFYKDRTASFYRPVEDGEFFKAMSPGKVEALMFGLMPISNYTTQRPYFDGMEHYMELGVVTIDRNIHYSLVLFMMQLYLHTPTAQRSAGDKELIWLGFALNGDEQYEFDDYAAAGIGELSLEIDNKNKFGEPRASREVCLNHPAHLLDEDDSLVWFNLGFQFCSKPDVNFEKEANKKSRFSNLDTVEKFKNYFTGRMRIRAAIVPPFVSRHQMSFPNDEDEVKEGWFKEWGYCSGYMYCAYSQVGGTHKGVSNKRIGRVFEFDRQQTALFDYLGDMWMGIEV